MLLFVFPENASPGFKPTSSARLNVAMLHKAPANLKMHLEFHVIEADSNIKVQLRYTKKKACPWMFAK